MPKNWWEADATALVARRAALGLSYRRWNYVVGPVDFVIPHFALETQSIAWDLRVFVSRNPSRRTDAAFYVRAAAPLVRRAGWLISAGAGRESYLVGVAPSQQVRSLQTLTGAAGVRVNAGKGVTIRMEVSVVRSRPVLSRRGVPPAAERRLSQPARGAHAQPWNPRDGHAAADVVGPGWERPGGTVGVDAIGLRATHRIAGADFERRDRRPDHLGRTDQLALGALRHQHPGPQRIARVRPQKLREHVQPVGVRGPERETPQARQPPGQRGAGPGLLRELLPRQQGERCVEGHIACHSGEPGGLECAVLVLAPGAQPIRCALRQQLQAGTRRPVVALGLEERQRTHGIRDRGATHAHAPLEQHVHREARRELHPVAEPNDGRVVGAAGTTDQLIAAPRLRPAPQVRAQAEARDRGAALPVRARDRPPPRLERHGGGGLVHPPQTPGPPAEIPARQ